MYTERLFNRDVVNEFTDVASVARRMIAINNAAPLLTSWSLPVDYSAARHL